MSAPINISAIRERLLVIALGTPGEIQPGEATDLLAELKRLEAHERWSAEASVKARKQTDEWRTNSRRMANAVQLAYNSLTRTRGVPEADKPLVELSLALGAHERLCTKEGVQP